MSALPTRRLPTNKRGERGRVIVVLNHKGGSCKTTSCYMIGCESAKAGNRNLFVDADTQMNLSGLLRHNSARFSGNIAGALEESALDPWNPETIKRQITWFKFKHFGPKLYLVPGYYKLDDTMAQLERAARYSGPEVSLRLKQAFDVLRPYFNFIFVDTSPAIASMPGSLALNAADHLLIPVDGLRAVEGAVQVLKRVRDNHGFRVAHGLGPLDVTLYSSRLEKNRLAIPYGPEGVRNADWYPLLCQVFPGHFLRPVIYQSGTVPRADTDRMVYQGMLTKTRNEYRTLHAAFMDRISHPATPLSTLLFEGKVDLDALGSKVSSLVTKEDRGVTQGQALLAKTRAILGAAS